MEFLDVMIRLRENTTAKGKHLDWYTSIIEVIDMRSFTSVWYWIMVAVVWSTSSHWILGVPFDAVGRARKTDGEAQKQLEYLVRINCNRLLYIVNVSGIWIVAIATFSLTVLAVLGFWYKVEICQAIFLIAAPMTFVSALSIRLARSIDRNSIAGEDLRRSLTRHRFVNQVIGMISIFITAFWGMWHNLSATVL